MDALLKKKILIGVACLIGLFFLAFVGWALYLRSQLILYQDTQYKFSIKYPNTWKIVINPRPNVAVGFMRPKDTALDTVQEDFSVTVQPVPTSLLALPAFSAKIKQQMIAVFSKNIRIVHDQPLYWGWREGREVIFEAPKPDHLIMVNAWVLRDDQAYIMTFFGDMNKYEQNRFLVQRMIRSLRLR